MFRALRVDPFLLHVADRDAELAPVLRALADDLSARKIALVHGDVSPKNILVAADGPVFLDAECAVYGDPAFDLDRKSTRSELQSLMRISYAVFCLKKKKQQSTQQLHPTRKT